MALHGGSSIAGGDPPRPAALEFRGFGLVEVLAGGRPVDVGPPRQRRVLAALMADVGRPVPLDAIIGRVWGDAAPERARDALYAYIARIRHALATGAAAVGADPVTVVRRSGGYLLDAAPEAVDLVQFRVLLDQARPADLPDQRKADLLRRALALCRGPALSEISGDWAEQLREGAERLRVAAALSWSDIELRRGNGADAIGLLADLHARHPLAEPIAASLMRALHAAGSRADALDLYATMRQRLVEELGADPSRELAGAHQAVLTTDVSPAPSARSAPSAPSAPSARTLGARERRAGRPASAVADGRAGLRRPGAGSGPARRGPGQRARRSRSGRGGRLGPGRSRQDRAGRALGAHRAPPVLRRPAVCEPAGLRSGGPAGDRR